MTTNEQDLRGRAYFAKRLRAETHGAATWDDAGLWSVLKRMEGHNLALTIERVTRHAADPEARTPAAIERPFVPDAPKAAPRYPPKAADECRNHPGEWADQCRICHGPQVADEQPGDRDTRPGRSNVSERVAELRRLKAGESA